MKTNNKIKIYDAKMWRGLCRCGKHGCGEWASNNKKKRHAIMHHYPSADTIEFTCQNGHRNRILI